MKEKETTERELEDERDKKLRKANEEARLDLTILEESHVKDSKMVEDLREKKIEELKQGIASKYGATPLVKKLGEARKKRMNIELDLENMTPEFQEKYGDLIQKDLIAARKEEQETEEALKAIDRKVEKELPGELEKAMKMGLLESGKVDTIFDDEKNRINTRLRKTTHDIERSFEKKKNELYQKYLMNLGNLFEKGLSGVKNHIMVLPDENRNYAQVVHDLNALLRNVDRTRRKFAMDLKKRLDGKKVSSLENKLSSSKMKHESELSELFNLG